MAKRKRLAAAIAVIAIGLVPGLASAQSDIPDLMGTWRVESAAVAHAQRDVAENEARFVSEPVFEMLIDWQDGRRFRGVEGEHNVAEEMVPLAGERFSGVIGFDNESAYLVDDNGFLDCRIMSAQRMECVYRHITPERSVASLNVWTKVD